MAIRINDQGGGDPHTQNPPPEHDMAGGCSSSSTVIADVPTAPMEAPEVLRGAMMSSMLSIPQEFADSVIAAPVASSPDSAPAPDIGSDTTSAPAPAAGPITMGSAVGADESANGPAAVSGSLHVGSAAGGAGIAWSLRDTGGKYNIGTPEEPIMRKAAPRMAAAGVQSTQQQQIAREIKVQFGGK